jgi:hypothetical protein
MATENDIVLIYFEDRPLTFARIEGILPDAKPNWYHVELLMLQVPLQVVSWILRDVYIDGEEFTMNGKKKRLELVEKPKPELAPAEAPAAPSSESAPGEDPPPPGQAKVISLKDLKGGSD